MSDARQTKAHAPRRAGPQQGPARRPAQVPKRRGRPGRVVLVAVGSVVVLAVVLVGIGLTSGSKGPSSASASTRTLAGPAIVQSVTGVSQAVADQIGAPGDLVPPKLLTGQPARTVGGKPGALYIGAEFCPYCGADMWPMIVALSRFGTFSGLSLTTSSPWDIHPSTATFSFYGSTYHSDYVTFETVEDAGNDTTGPGTHRRLQAPTQEQGATWRTYSSLLGVAQGYPFLDIGNRAFLVGAPYDPSLLAGLDQQAIAAKLSNPSDPVARAIVGSANELTAAICSVTGGQPGAVCSAPSTVAGARALGLR